MKKSRPPCQSWFRPNNQEPITNNPIRIRESSAFTLIELLVVISIIIILMGLLFPAFKGVQDQAKKTQAKNDVAQMVTAVNAYYADYGTYPLNSRNNGGTSDTVYGDPNGTFTSADLFNILRAISDSNYNASNQLNIRQVAYFSGPTVKDQNNQKSGFASVSGSSPTGYTVHVGDYLDPWGNPYVVFLDADFNNEITQALSWFYTAQYNVGTDHVTFGSGACSLGKDGKWGDNNNGKVTGSDDVVSWQ